MLYDKYQNKMKGVVRRLGKFRRHRVLILSVLCAVIALTAGFFATKGLMFGESDFAPNIAYGDELDYSAKAMFGKVQYEYRAEGETEWSTEKPTKPGKFYVRSVAKSGFGKPRYGDEHSFTIAPKPLRVTIGESEILYGETPTVVTSGLAYTDTLKHNGLSYADMTKETTDVSVIRDGISIYNADGEDVTAYYAIETPKTALTFLKREITITAASAEIEYNGQPLKSESYQLTSGSFAAGDEPRAVFDCTQTAIGVSENVPVLTIVNAQGLDVTAHYKITKNNGTLTVNKRVIVITTAGAEYIYSGTEYTNDDHTISPSTPLLAGHKLVVSKAPGRTDVGEWNNHIKFVVLDQNDQDVTDCYDWTQVIEGKLVIKPREITVRTETAEFAYDGTEHSATTPIVVDKQDGLASGHTIEIVKAAGITDPGSCPNKGVAVIKKGNVDVTSNYKIEYDYGELTVRKRRITITTASASKVYDGTELTAHDFTIDSEDGEMTLLPGHTIVNLKYLASITNVAKDNENKILHVDNIIEYDIYEGGESVRERYYDVKVIPGKLTITPRPFEFTSASDSKTYDGTELTKGEYTDTTDKNDYNGLLDGAEVELEYTGTITDVGDEKNEFRVVKITWNGEDVTGNYAPTLIPGTLTVSQREIIVKVDNQQKTYDATALEGSTVTITKDGAEEGAMADGQKFVYNLEGSQLTAGESSCKILEDWYVIWVNDDPDAPVVEVKRENYKVTLVDGTLTVDKRYIHVTSDSDSKVYDGTALEVHSYVADSNEEKHQGLLESVHEIKATYLVNPTDVCEELPNFFEIVIHELGNPDADVSDNYEIDLDEGTLTITPRPVVITSNSADKIYDGKELTEHNYTDITEKDGYNGLVEGHTLVLTYTGTITNVGDTKNSYTFVEIRDANNNLIDSKNYAITFEEGTLEVTKREITITAASDTKVFDGLELKLEINDGRNGLVTENADLDALDALGFTYKVVAINGAQRFAGWSYVTIPEGGFRIFLGEEDVTGNFIINRNAGTLTVTPCEITIEAADLTKPFDGTLLEALSGMDAIKDNATLNWLNTLEGNNFALEVTEVEGSIFFVGSTDSVIKKVKITWNGEDVTSSFIPNYVPGTLTITKRDITVTAASASKEFDGFELKAKTGAEGIDATAFAELLANNPTFRWNVVKASGGTIIADTVKSSIALKDFEIFVTYEGEEYLVTDQFNITFVEGDLTVTPLDITVKAESATKVYDATPLDAPLAIVIPNEVLVALNNLHGSEVFTYKVLSAEGTITNVGSADCWIEEGELRIYLNDKDVTDSFNIAYEKGELTVTPRPVVITSNSADKTYDGTALAEHSYTDITEKNGYNGLVEGHKLVLTYTGTITNVGYKPNTYTFVEIRDANNNLIDPANYAFDFKEGTLTVTPREITITAASDTKVFDGLELKLEINDGRNGLVTENADLDELDELGFTYKVVAINGAQRFAGSCDVTIPEGGFGIFLGEEDVTANFIINRNAGTLTVTKREITIEAADLTKPFDGTLLEALSGMDAIKDNAMLNWLNTLEGNNFALEVTEVEGFRLLAGTADSVIKKVKITWNGEDVTSSFIPTYVPGTLTVTKRDITITAKSDSKPFNGLALKAPTGAEGIEDAAFAELLAKNPTFRWDVLEASGEITRVGTENSSIDPRDFKVYVTYEGVEYDATESFVITFAQGTLEVTKREITITAASDSKVYDATPLTAPLDIKSNDVLVYLNSLSSSNVFTYKVLAANGSITNAGEHEWVIEEGQFEIYLNGEDVTDQFAITYAKGTLTVTPRPVVITSNSADKTYDGTALAEHSYTDITEKNGYNGLVEGHTLVLNYTGTITDAGNTKNTFDQESYKILDENGKPIDLRNYAITFEEGTLEVTKREITIQPIDRDKTFDGQELVGLLGDIDTALAESVREALKQLTELYDFTYEVVKTEGGQRFAGSCDVTIPKGGFVVRLNGVDVTANFAITYNVGTLTVNKLAIIITAADANKSFDGTPLLPLMGTGKDIKDNTTLNDLNDIVGNNFACTVVEAEGSCFFEGSADSVIKKVKITWNGEDVTSSFIPTYVPGTLTVTKRDITITAKSDSKPFNGLALKAPTGAEGIEDAAFAELLAKNPTFRWDVLEASGEITRVGTENSSIDPRDFKVYVTYEGEEYLVTDQFNITFAEGTLEVTKREITITAASDSKVYDATPLTAPLDIKSNDVLAYLNKLSSSNVFTYKVLAANGSITNAGELDWVIEEGQFEIYLNGEDVTDQFAITYAEGTLTVVPRPFELTSGSDSKTYDGTELTKHDYEETTKKTGLNGLLEGDTVELSFTGAITNAGNEKNNFTVVKITNAAGDDVTDNYAPTCIPGNLTVNKREITIQPIDRDKTFDGQELVGLLGDIDTALAESVREALKQLTELCDFTYEVVKTEGGQRFAGSCDVTIPEGGFRIFLGEEDVTANFAITYNPGTLTVTKREIIIEAKDGNKSFDGTPLFAKDGVEGAKPNELLAELNKLEGNNFVLEVTEVEGSVFFVGSTDSVIKKVKITWNGEDVTESFIPNYVSGTLTITQCDITITAKSDSKPFNGLALKAPTGAEGIEDAAFAELLAKNPTFRWNVLEASGEITFVGKKDSEITKFVIYLNYEGEERDVTDQFNITFKPGTLTITTRNITVTAASDSKVYDGKPLNAPAALASNPLNSLPGPNVFTYEVLSANGSITEVGTTNSEIKDGQLRIYMNGEDVTNQFAIDYRTGTLEVTGRNITIFPNGGTKTYDGEAHVQYYTIGGSGLAEGHKITSVEWNCDPTGIGTHINGVNILKIEDADGNDVTGEYVIDDSLTNEIIVTERTLIIDTNSGTAIYNGKTYNQTYTIGGDGLASGHTIQSKTWTSDPLNFGTYTNDITINKIVDAAGNDVTENYKITTNPGEITIEKREIVVVTNSGNKVYDGKDYDHAIIDVAGYGLVEGHKITACTWHENTVNVGTYKNDVTINKIVDAAGNDVTGNYEITTTPGEITIEKRKVTVSTNGGSKVYDAEEFPVTIKVQEMRENVGLVNGQSYQFGLMLDFNPVNVGAYENTLDWIEFYDADGETKTTHNYEIIVEEGTIVIEARKIIVVTNSVNKVYDGKGYEHAIIDVQGYGLVEGHKITDCAWLTNTVNAGAYYNDVVVHTILSEDQFDVTSNYAIEVKYGKIQIEKRKVTVSTNGGSKVYDAEEFPVTIKVQEMRENVGLVNGQSYQFGLMLDFNPVNVGAYENTLDWIEFYDADGETKTTHNYEIIVEEGTIVIEARKIIVVTNSVNKVYDGKGYEHAIIDVQGYGLVEGHKITDCAWLTNTVNAGAYYNDVVVHTILSEDQFDVTSNYAIEVECGKIQIDKRKVTVGTNGLTKVYDDKAVSLGVIVQNMQGDTGLVTGQSYQFGLMLDFNPVDVGVYENALDWIKFYDADGVTETTGNYKILLKEGTVVIEARKIIIVTNSVHKIYDGTVGYENEIIEIGGMYGLIKGHEITKWTWLVTTADAGDYYNMVEIDEVLAGGDRDVTKNYAFEIKCGKIWIEKREITVKAASDSKFYDGEPLNAPLALYEEGNKYLKELVELGFTWEVIKANGTQTEVGYSSAFIPADGFVIYLNGEDVTANFKITLEQGTLSVYEKPEISDDLAGKPILNESGQIGGNPVMDGADGSNKDGDTPAGRVLAQKSGRIYLRYRSYGDYTGNSWSTTPNESPYLLDGAYSMNYLTGLMLDSLGYECLELRIETYGNYLLPYYLELGSGDQVSDVEWDGGAGEYTVSYYAYSSNGLILLGSVPADYTKAEQAYRKFVHDEYTSVPERTKQYLLTFMEENGLRADDPDIIRKVAKCIRNAATYSLQYDRELDHEEDVVVAFLDQYKEGICQHYASAATLIYRLLGIPARYTGGYVAQAEANEWTTFTASEAHAWVEVYLDGIGWIQVEVTGSSDDGDFGGDVEPGEIDGKLGRFEIQEEIVVGRVYAQKTGAIYLRTGSFGDYQNGNSWAQADEYSGAYSMNYLTGLALNALGYDRLELQLETLYDYTLPYYMELGSGGEQTGDVAWTGEAGRYTVSYYAYNDYGSTLIGSLPADYAQAEEAYRKFVYDEYMAVPETTAQYLHTFMEENELHADDPDIIRKVAECIQNAATYNLDYDSGLDDAKDIVIAFLEEYQEGVCRHYASAATLIYRLLGIPARYTVGYMVGAKSEEWTDFSTAEAHAWVEVYLDGVGWVKVEVTGGGFDFPEEDSRTPVNIYLYTMKFNYDGKEHSYHPDRWYYYPSTMPTGYKVMFELSGSLVDAGSLDLEELQALHADKLIVLDDQGVDVSDQYRLVLHGTPLTVTHREITLTAGSASKTEDDSALTCNDYDITFGSLVEGHYIDEEEIVIEGAQFTPGRSENEIKSVIIRDANGKDVTANYKISLVKGTLTVNPKLEEE